MIPLRPSQPGRASSVSAEPLRVLIADDHVIVRKGLVALFREVPDRVIVGEAGDGREALELALSQEWDAAILDITMPGLGGVQVLQAMKRVKPNVPVVILSVHADESYISMAMSVGADGFLQKEAAPEELLIALRAVLAGEKYLGAGLPLD